MTPPSDPSISAKAADRSQQPAASSQLGTEPRETAGGNSSKSSISWGVINENRQDSVPVSRFSSPPQKSEDAAAAGRVLLQTGNSQFGAPLLTGASSHEKSRWASAGAAAAVVQGTQQQMSSRGGGICDAVGAQWVM
eukprot:COSAG01_NODE_16_length_40091_cov_15.728646_24_plen_137_part_00